MLAPTPRLGSSHFLRSVYPHTTLSHVADARLLLDSVLNDVQTDVWDFVEQVANKVAPEPAPSLIALQPLAPPGQTRVNI